jgi:hypothetical protein
MTALAPRVEVPLRGGALPAPAPLPLPSPRRALAAKSTAALAPPPAIAPAPVRAWRDTHLKKGKRKLGSWPVYQHYVKWCKTSNLKAATFTQFDFELCEAGIKKATEGHNTFYLEIDL